MSNGVYGYVNGNEVYSRDEFIYAQRGFVAIDNDNDLMEFAKKVSGNWKQGGWTHKFTDFYLGDYALNEPYRSLTKTEYARLRELQVEARAKEKAEDEARCWEKVETTYWADNSVEETWRDKDGNTKIVMVVPPHGDACY